MRLWTPCRRNGIHQLTCLSCLLSWSAVGSGRVTSGVVAADLVVLTLQPLLLLRPLPLLLQLLLRMPILSLHKLIGDMGPRFSPGTARLCAHLAPASGCEKLQLLLRLLLLLFLM